MLQIVYLYASLIGMGVTVSLCIYFLHRKRTRGKIICYFYTKTRFLHRRALRPSSIGVINWQGKSYLYQEEYIHYTSAFLFREPFPTLVFNEDSPHPVNLPSLDVTPVGVGDEEVSSSELSHILNDSTVQDFVHAQSKVQLGQVMQAVGVSMLVVVGVVAASAYYILQRIGELSS